MKVFNDYSTRMKVSPSFLGMAIVALLLAFGTIPKGLSQTSAPDVEIVEQDAVGMFAHLTEYLIDFQILVIQLIQFESLLFCFFLEVLFLEFQDHSQHFA